MKLSVILCAWNIDDATVNKFIEYNSEMFSDHEYEIIVVSERPIENCVSLIYPLEQPIFSIPKTINYGIRRARGEIIIKTDPDIAFSKEVVQHAINAASAPGKGMICICANIASWAHLSPQINWARTSKRRKGRGACFAMHRDDWFSLNGYDERIQGWGGDDEEMWRRAGIKIEIIENWSYPLYHVNHPLRKSTNGGSFPINSRRNMSITKNHDWKDPHWGDPLKELL